MAEYHFPVPGSKDENEIVLFVRRHWASFLGQFLLSVILFLVPIVILIIIRILDRNFFHDFVYNILVIILSIYYLVALTFAFVSWLSFYYNVYIVTTREIIDITQVGFFGRKISQLSLLRVQDVTSNVEGILPTLFGYGNVLVETAGEQSENFLICSVPNPQEISSKIMEIHDQVIETEGRQNQILRGEGALVSGKSLESEQMPQKEPTDEAIKKATPYEKLLNKEKSSSLQKSPERQKDTQEGEINKNDLEHGGQIDLK